MVYHIALFVHVFGAMAMFAAAGVVLTVWNGLFMEQYRSNRIPRDLPVAFSQVAETNAEILSRAVPDARDSYIDAQSRYRGGAATALEVLDAHAAAVEAAVRRSDAIARYRVADAVSLRWGTP